MGHAADDKRKFQRFDIHAPAMMEVGAAGQQTLEIHTRDISAGGAFFFTSEPLGVGSKIKAEIVIPNETITNLTGTEFQLRVHGTVVRSDADGIGVRFSGQEIMPVGSRMDN